MHSAISLHVLMGALARFALAVVLIAGSTMIDTAVAGLFVSNWAYVPPPDPGPRPLAGIRSRLVHVDTGEVANHIAPIGGSAADRLARAGQLDGVITIELFPDVIETFRRTNVEGAGQTSIGWSGNVGGSPIHAATLIVNNSGQITGSVQLGALYFVIEPVAGTLHRVSEIDRDAYPAHEDDFKVAPPSENPPEIGPQAAVTPTPTVITVLAAYTPAALRQSPNVVNLIQLAIAGANTAYRGTQIPIQLRLVATMSTGSYNEGPDTFAQWTKVLDQVTGLSTPIVLGNVRLRRNQVKADLVFLVVRNSTVACGLGWVVENPSAATSNYGFSVQAVGCLAGNIVLPHEFGHNMGLRHDRLTEGGTWPNIKYNFGYVNKAARKIDLMAYTEACTRQGIPNCIYVPWFSTSQYKVNNTAVLGIARGQPGAADATRRLREVRAGVAAYR